MATVEIRAFARLEAGAEDFLNLPARLEGLSAEQAAAERAGTAALLSPGNCYFQHSAALNFVAYRAGQPVGRITAFHNRWLVEDHTPYGLAGLFCCEDNRETASYLICHAADWLNRQGAVLMRGPMAGDIWHRWRFMTRGFETAPFPGEPRQPEYYPQLFIDSGFAPVRTYSTKLITNLSGQYELLRKPLQFNRKRGISFRNFDQRDWQGDLGNMYELCRYSFGSSWSVTETTRQEFCDVYDRWLKRASPEHVLFACDAGGQVVGLGLAIIKPADTINLKTIAVLPSQWGRHLGQAIAGELYERALSAGLRQAQHCLLGPLTPAQRWDRGLGRVTREYQMYERAV